MSNFDIPEQTVPPETVFESQRHPLDKAVDNLKEAGQATNDEWSREALDAIIQYIQKEVEK